MVAVTAYDYTSSYFASRAGVDLILVGDSLGTTALGFETTVPVTMNMMLHHTAAVARAAPEALVVTDIPFAVAHGDFDRLLTASARCLQESGAEAVKIEGGEKMADRISQLVDAGIPVLGHVGLLPQQVLRLGGYRQFGRTPEEKEQLLADVRSVEAAGAFAIVAEMVDPACAAELTAALDIPLIGIGSGPHCDGQILVSHDLLGMTAGKVPAFVKRYGELGAAMEEAFMRYAAEVREKRFPEEL